MKGYDPSYSRKMLQLLRVIAGTALSKPNISNWSERIGINRTTLLNYLRYLEKQGSSHCCTNRKKSISVLQKPDKIFLNNPNLYYVLNPVNISVGSMRETFFQSQLNVVAEVSLHPKTDFLVVCDNQQYAFEVGGSNKKLKSSIQQRFRIMPSLLAIWFFVLTWKSEKP